MKPVALTAAALVGCLLLPVPAAPQDVPSPGPGARVRITVPGLGFRKQVAILEDTTGAVWTLKPSPSSRIEWRLESNSITDVEVSVGSHHHAVLGALIGALTIGGIGALAGQWAGDDVPCPAPRRYDSPYLMDAFELVGLLMTPPCVSRTASQKASDGAHVGGVVGLALGLGFGLLARSDDWTPGSVPVSMAPVTGQDRQFGLAFRLTTR